MEFGGSDISRCLNWLLCRAGACIPKMNLQEVLSFLQLQEVKEAFVHMDQVFAYSYRLFCQFQNPHPLDGLLTVL